MSMEEIIREFPKALLVWYDFKHDADILYIYDICENVALTELLREKAGNGVVNVVSVSAVMNNKASKITGMVAEDNAFDICYDYIVVIGLLEISESPKCLLAALKSILKSDGKLLVGAQNRLGLKYFCGDRDPYTNHSFDGIENYHRLSVQDKKSMRGRCYSGAELKEMLGSCGFDSKFYSVFPDLNNAQLVYAQNYIPVEELSMRYFPMYNYPDSVFLNEQFLYTDLIKNGMFHTMANSYIIECKMYGEFESILHATISLDRGRKNAMVTKICGDTVKHVYKKAIYREGVGKLENIKQNLLDLRRRGINVVDAEVKGDFLVMPYIDAPIAMNELKALAKRDCSKFIQAMDDMRELILMSSDHTDIISEKDMNSANGRDLGIILEKGYIDMVPLNCFYVEEYDNPLHRFVYYDQEFYWENCPANAIIYRSIIIIYDNTDNEFEALVPKEFFFERYGLFECMDIWECMSMRFNSELRNQREMAPYYYNKCCDPGILYTNREKINYSAVDYNRIFVNIFDGIEEARDKGINKKIILFGSGVFTSRFLTQFAKDYYIYSIIDNNSKKWGDNIEGIPINSPDIIKYINPKELHVIICIKNYFGVARQLESMGIEKYYIYDPGNDYTLKRKSYEIRMNTNDTSLQLEETSVLKPYNIGYIAGVFDLFHVGHLNMFKRAKELCNYLIVGVVSDEGVRLNKQAEPFVPFDERIEMIRSCRYVDEAVKLSLNCCGTRDMFRVYHFDVQFSGSDYENDPGWLAEKEFLEKNGSTMVFFPYTKSTSSTKLKGLINERLI